MTKVSDKIARYHWEQAAIEQARADYRRKGYKVQTNARLGKLTADLVARRGKKTVVVEFKSGPWTRAKARSVEQLRNYAVHELGAKFLLAWAAPPRERKIEVEGLEGVLADYISNEMPSELDRLSTHTRVDGVSDVFVSSIKVEAGRTTVAGEAAVEVELVYGSSGDEQRGDGARMSDSYPLTFEVVLDPDLQIIEVDDLEIDTSSFYE